MTRKIQSYPQEFKSETVRTVLNKGRTISESASLLSVPYGTPGQWLALDGTPTNKLR